MPTARNGYRRIYIGAAYIQGPTFAATCDKDFASEGRGKQSEGGTMNRQRSNIIEDGFLSFRGACLKSEKAYMIGEGLLRSEEGFACL